MLVVVTTADDTAVPAAAFLRAAAETMLNYILR